MRVSWEFSVGFAYTFFPFDNPGTNQQGVLCLLPVENFDWFVFTESKSESVKTDRESMKTDVEQRTNKELPTFVDTNKTLPISLCLFSPSSVCSVFSHFYNLADELMWEDLSL